MLALFCVWTVSLLVNFGQPRDLKVLNYSLLNQEETIRIQLQRYFKIPSQVVVDDKNSSENIRKILDINFTKKAITQMSSLVLKAKLSDNTTVDFSNRTLIKQRSIFNYPNKVFLMDKNYVFSVRYQVSNSDNSSYVRAFKIDTPLNCTQIEVQQYKSSYYVFVGCIRVPAYNLVSIFTYKFTQPQSGFLDQLVALPKIDVRFSLNCSKIILYSYDQLFTTYLSQSKVLLGCTTTTKSNQQSYMLNIYYFKSLQNVNASSIVNGNLTYCIRESNKIIEYQKGFLSFSSLSLNYYSYNPSSNTSTCTNNFLNTTGSKFVASVKDQDTHYIYVIYQDKIIIKQSYSPNYGAVSINQTEFSTMTVENYCISQRFLGLLYRNNTHYCFLTFDLRTSYPKLVDYVIETHSYSFLFLYSVNNFLSKSNYYLVYDSVSNVLNLNYYVGYELNLTVNDSEQAVGSYVLALTDGQDDLLLNFNFRGFDDITLQKSSQIEEKLMFQRVLTLNLSNYINGPLGRFYTYPNTQSLFQYVNYLCETSVQNELSKIKEKLAAISVNNVMSVTLITFYYQNKTILTCELDFSMYNRQAELTECKPTRTRKNVVNISKSVIVLSKEAFIQYDSLNIELCQLIVSGQYECSQQLKTQILSNLVGIKLVSYAISNVQQSFSLIIYCKKQILYCRLERKYPYRTFSTFKYYHITKNTLSDFNKMSIVDLCFDNYYKHFLVVRFGSDDVQGSQKVVVYDKPFIRSNSETSLIGHVIQVFENTSLEALFCFDNLLILVTKQDKNFIIRQYMITRQYRLRFTRTYPLYKYRVKQGGRHKQDQNFIFLEIEEDNAAYYLVYAPLLPTSNILTHKIQIKSSKVYFSQQIGSIENSSLILNGGNILGITVPNIILRLMPNSVSDLGVILVDFNVSVVDIMNRLSILNYQFSFNEKEQQIQYFGDTELTLDSSVLTKNFTISADNVSGFVEDYIFSIPDTEQCQNFKFERTDIFTKQQSLLYYQSQQYGTLNDFVAVILNGKEVEVVVTDTRLFCVVNKQLPTSFNPSFRGLQSCRFETTNNQILMSCINTTTLYRSIFNITVGCMNSSCFVGFQQITIPQVLVHQDFDIQFTRNVIMLQVPIRMEQKKIYYKAQLQISAIADKYSLLVRNTQNKVLQTQFQTIDSTLSSEVFLLLEDGIGVYNLSDSSDLVLPALWIDSTQLHEIVGDENFAYLMLLKIQMQNNKGMLLVQLGTEYRTFQIQIKFAVSNSSSPYQTIYNLQQIQMELQYRQYLNCRNTISSSSQRFENLIVKICSYEPKEESVFANFVEINNETANSLIQFYKKKENTMYPFRIDVIYSNPDSNHEFTIINNTLVVGSLFNMLCYYALTPQITWNITYSAEDNNFDETCQINLTIVNRHNSIPINLSITYDGDRFQQQYLSVGVFYIQRVLLFLILVNTIRLQISKRKKSQERTKRRENGRLHTSKFEVMVKINSKKSM